MTILTSSAIEELRERAASAGLSSRIEVLGRRALNASEVRALIVVAGNAGDALVVEVDAGGARGGAAGTDTPVPERSGGVGAGHAIVCGYGAGRATGVAGVAGSVDGVQVTSSSTGSAFGGI